jgi:hypothetical protein
MGRANAPSRLVFRSTHCINLKEFPFKAPGHIGIYWASFAFNILLLFVQGSPSLGTRVISNHLSRYILAFDCSSCWLLVIDGGSKVIGQLVLSLGFPHHFS